MSAPAKGCGGCTLCCKLMGIHNDDGTERSAPGSWCPDCDIGHACKVYETRPNACADFECVWLASQREEKPLPDELRPDRCKVVICATTNTEAGQEGERALVAHVDPGRPDAYLLGRLGAWLAAVGREYPIFVTVGQKRMTYGRKAVELMARKLSRPA